jgi:hypothetical protein
MLQRNDSADISCLGPLLAPSSFLSSPSSYRQWTRSMIRKQWTGWEQDAAFPVWRFSTSCGSMLFIFSSPSEITEVLTDLQRVSQVPMMDWETSYQWALLILSVVLFAAFSVWELRYAKSSIMPPTIWTSPSFMSLVIVVLVSFMSFGSLLWYMGQQVIRHWNVIQFGVGFLPLAHPSTCCTIYHCHWFTLEDRRPDSDCHQARSADILGPGVSGCGGPIIFARFYLHCLPDHCM